MRAPSQWSHDGLLILLNNHSRETEMEQQMTDDKIIVLRYQKDSMMQKLATCGHSRCVIIVDAYELEHHCLGQFTNVCWVKRSRDIIVIIIFGPEHNNKEP